MTVNANGVERVFCGKNEDSVGRSVPDETVDEFEPEEEGKHHDGDLSNVEEGFPIIVVPSGSAVVTFQSNWDYAKSGFELEIAELSRLQVIEIHAQVILTAIISKYLFRFSANFQFSSQKPLREKIPVPHGENFCPNESGVHWRPVLRRQRLW